MLQESTLPSDKEVEYIRVCDSWRTEWHKDGVQVLVKSAEERKVPQVRIRRSVFKRPNLSTPQVPFKLPEAYVRRCVTQRSSRRRRLPVRYQLDRLDYAWLETENEERVCMGLDAMQDWQLERIIDLLERLCYKKMRRQLHEVETKALEFDENAKCDVCQSKEGEEDNELVFCEECFLCVHQACYGIEELPIGTWLCARCEMKAKPTTACILCPNTGGAMKLTNDHRWCHVSCALWIPEVTFGNVSRMEPIIHVENIPMARRRLRCFICRVRQGACIQCDYGKCRVAFHYTCAVQAGLETSHVLSKTDVKLLAFCDKHSASRSQGLGNPDPSSKSSHPVGRILSAEDVRRQKLSELEASFHATLQSDDLHWALHSLRPSVAICRDIQEAVTTYWRLKRRSQHNRACLPCATNCDDLLSLDPDVVVDASQQLHAFTTLRFSLDHARLMIDMIKRREKQKLALLNNFMEISQVQLDALLSWRDNDPVPESESVAEVMEPLPSWLRRCHRGIKRFLAPPPEAAAVPSYSLGHAASLEQQQQHAPAESALTHISRSQLVVTHEIAQRVRESLQRATHLRHLFTLPMAAPPQQQPITTEDCPDPSLQVDGNVFERIPHLWKKEL